MDDVEFTPVEGTLDLAMNYLTQDQLELIYNMANMVSKLYTEAMNDTGISRFVQVDPEVSKFRTAARKELQRREQEWGD